MSAEPAKEEPNVYALAQAFVFARKSSLSLDVYPGPVPSTLEQAYACQEAAIELWPDEIAGWKIGLIAPQDERRYGERRLAGPIFRQSVRSTVASAPVRFPVFRGGFAAVEAEFIFEVLEDVPAHKLAWTTDDAMQVAVHLRAGVELAGSPLATINDLGPPVIISDFGNNAGLVLGTPVKDWREREPASLTCETYIEHKCVGRGNAAGLPGGPIEALRWVLEHCAHRGRPLRAGQFVSSGAVTGVHEIRAGQVATIKFDSHGAIGCQAFVAEPDADHVNR